MSRRLAVTGDDRDEAVALARAAGFTLVTRDPELVLCHGGDGTLLRAERLFPGVPKLPVRVERHARLCPRHSLPAVLERLAAGSLEEERLDLLALSVGQARFRALNDVVLRNENPAVAVRFRVHVDGEPSPEFTGDGVVLATPFGSTGYYRSITGQQVEQGIGIALNNCTRPVPPRVVPPGSRVVVDVVRGPAVLVHDNDARPIGLRAGHHFEVSRAEEQAVTLGLDALRCQECRRADDLDFNPH